MVTRFPVAWSLSTRSRRRDGSPPQARGNSAARDAYFHRHGPRRSSLVSSRDDVRVWPSTRTTSTHRIVITVTPLADRHIRIGSIVGMCIGILKIVNNRYTIELFYIYEYKNPHKRSNYLLICRFVCTPYTISPV